MATKCYLKHFWASNLYNLYLFNHGIASPVKHLNPINHSHTKGLSNALCTDLGGYAGDAMKSTAKGQPALPMELPPALTTMGEPWPMADCEWSFAGFGEVFDYLRGNRKLEIPPEYRAVIPRKIG